MDLKSLLIAIASVVPSIIIGAIGGYLYDKPKDSYDVFEDYYGRKE